MRMMMPELNPVLVKELRGRMRSARAFILLTIYLVILSGVTLLLYVALSNNRPTDLNNGRQIGQALFFTVAAVALIEVCVITPSLTAGGIAGEKERQTYDLLIASQLSPWQIVWGKLGAALAFSMLLVLAIVPIMSMAFLFGGVSLTEVLIVLIGLGATAVFYACIGLFWSSIMRSTLGANSFALGSIILMLLGIPFIAVVFTLIFGPTGQFWLNSAFLVYVGGMFLSIHPFIALALTEGFIRQGDAPFSSTVQLSTGVQVWIPSPWIAFVVLALFFSALLVLLSMRAIRSMSDTETRTRAEGTREQSA